MKALSLMCLLTGFAAVCGGPQSVMAAEQMKPSGAIEAVMSDDPSDFYESAASLNQLEIEASKLALERSTDADIKAYANTMVKDHTAASQKLTNLATSKNVDLPKELLKRHQLMLDSLKEQDAGPGFDSNYRTKMLLSHKEAISLFDQSSKESPDPDIRKFAMSMMSTLQDHGSRAQKLEDNAQKKAGKKS
jgi:putative membrane protein